MAHAHLSIFAVHLLKLSWQLNILFPGTSYITVLPPIPTAGMTKDDLPELMERTYEIMNKTFVESTTECLEEQVRSLKCEWYKEQSESHFVIDRIRSVNSCDWLIQYLQCGNRTLYYVNQFPCERTSSFSHDFPFLKIIRTSAAP